MTKKLWETMPMVDEWIAARTVPGGRARIGELWEDWSRYMVRAGAGDPAWWKTRTLHGALAARGYGFHKSGDRFVVGLTLRPVGELAPIAQAGEGAPAPRASQDVL